MSNAKTNRIKRVLPLLLFTAVLALSACNMPNGAATEDVVATNAAETVAAELTSSAGESPAATDTPAPATATDEPEATATEAEPSATPEATGCTDRASFVTDVTVPDDTNFAAGESFTKTWRLRNSGTCTWTTEYDLIFDSGRAMDGPASKALTGNVPPNSTVDLSVDLTAPETEGTHRGNWMLRNAEGVSFGIGSQAQTAFWVQIVVGPTPTPEPEVYNTAKDTLKPSFYVDLDEGDFSPSDEDRDLWYHSVSDDERYLEPQNGAIIDLWEDGVPSYGECEGADLSGDDLSFDDFGEGDWICFKTNEGRIGRFEIEDLSADTAPHMLIDIRTWE